MTRSPQKPLKQRRNTRRIYHLLRQGCTILFVLCLVTSHALGFENLTPAQTLIYDKPHLENTSDGQTLTYNYRAEALQGEAVSDRVLLSVSNAKDDGKRDVTLDFLSDERHMTLPDFAGYRGNPVIIAMLEYIAKTLGAETGGGALYFRNRIRDQLADKSVNIAQTQEQLGDKNIKATQVTFLPFENDSYVAKTPHLARSVFTLSFSDEVPGGVVGISVESTKGDAIEFYHAIKLDSL